MTLRRLTRVDSTSDESVAAYVSDTSHTDMASRCLIWDGKVQERILEDRTIYWPLIGLPNRQQEQVRRFWWAYCNPDEDLTGYRVRRDPDGTCDPLCFNPDHMLVEPRPGYVEA